MQCNTALKTLGHWIPGPWVPGPWVPGPWVPGPWVPSPWVPGPWVPGPWVPGPWVPGPWVPGPWVPGPWGLGFRSKSSVYLPLWTKRGSNVAFQQKPANAIIKPLNPYTVSWSTTTSFQRELKAHYTCGNWHLSSTFQLLDAVGGMHYWEAARRCCCIFDLHCRSCLCAEGYYLVLIFQLSDTCA